MWPTYSIQRHICALFLASAILSSLLVIKRKSTTQHTPTYQNVTDEPLGKYRTLPQPDHFAFARKKNMKTLHILGLFELSTKWGERTEGLSEIAAAELAIKHVNQFNILPDYTLDLVVNDTKCDPGVGIDRFFHAIYSDKVIAMLLGTSCSNVTQSLAHIVPYWNILQISFGSTSPSLSDRQKFPLFFRTVAPDSSHNKAKIEFVKHFSWKVVAAFCQSEDEYLLPLNKLIADFELENISCVTTTTFSLDNYKEQLKALKVSDIRIIIGSFSNDVASIIFCEVYLLEMYGTDYVWILQDRHVAWWNEAQNCDVSRLQKSADGLILVSDYNVVSENNIAVSGLNNDLFESQLNIPKSEISQYASLTYDAIWTMAFSLKDFDSSFKTEFNYKRRDLVYEIKSRMSSLNFMGISGPLRFIGADRVGSSVLRQLQNGQIRNIALFDWNTSQLDFECKICHQVNWWGKQTPIAQRILKLSLIIIPKILLYFVIFVSTLGIVFSLFFFYFNLHFRRIKTVKLSSPKLNIVAVVGCVLVYLYVMLLGFDMSRINKYENEFCTVRVYLLSSGFSLAFGSMFAKTYRVHRIFAYYGGTSKVKDMLLKDKQLIALILIPLIIDGIILTLWVMIDPLERQLHNLTLEINSEDRGVVYQPQVQVCRSRNTSGWFVAIYGYKGLILIMGVYMAWETRHVKVQALNDSQYIGICVYSAVFSAIITVLTSFINEYVVFSYLAQTLSILTSTTLTLFLLFLPKLKTVFGGHHTQDPIMQSMGLKIEYNTRRFINNDPKEQIFRLEIQNKVFKCELAALDLEIARLESLLNEDHRRATKPNIYTIYKKQSVFSKSDYTLNQKKVLEHIPVISEMKHFIEKRKLFKDVEFLKVYNVNQKRNSDPDFGRPFAARVLPRAKSDLDIIAVKNSP